MDEWLRQIMRNIRTTCLDAAAEDGMEENSPAGAKIAGFVKVVNAMLDQGLVQEAGTTTGERVDDLSRTDGQFTGTAD